ncbi:hypothetical protein BGW80DRAFT_232661 [Lactifluus volemus]|nr:hypothetical protein BGW80DRAFT_232661 [Lactifluus volemus]
MRFRWCVFFLLRTLVFQWVLQTPRSFCIVLCRSCKCKMEWVIRDPRDLIDDMSFCGSRSRTRAAAELTHCASKPSARLVPRVKGFWLQRNGPKSSIKFALVLYGN